MPLTDNFPGFFEALVENTGQAFFAYDLTAQQFTFVNQECAVAFKQPNSDLSPSELLGMVNEDDQPYVLEKLEDLVKHGKGSRTEFRIQFPDQPEQWVCVTVSLLQEPSGKKMILGHIEDISIQRTYNDHLKRFSNKKNSVLNILAHDLAGPLGMIQNLTGILSEQLEAKEEEDAQETLRVMLRISKQSTNLLREFMNNEFLESSKTQLVTRRVNLKEKMAEMLVEYQNERGDLLGVNLDFVYTSDEVYAEVDDLKFMQIITNLISNSLKFTPTGGRITVTLEEEDTTVLVTVADTGIGIPDKYHDTLFEKFTPARRPGLKGEQSVGLGMSIIKTLVDWHKGQIWFESEESKGTTFYLRVPKEQQ
ncbi:PAS domain-containing sensor histidine kinase [Rufibacter tibetensis]|uniref:histidine kinase n=1 Tax=Rufibacter tibetensis TaxID=512763 RepID=A0A0N7HX14_9BACT|nr:PAS domain-containing sensor histidine kinase [Rufibacter tibetensis]ALJ00777.1 hypothetical protein DC20_19535 [Rufibacter tibetensis]